jgi:hypothetical protein
MWIYIGLGALAIILMVLLPYFMGSPRFWRLVQRHPDDALELFRNNDNWLVDSSPPKELRSEFVGPFRVNTSYGETHILYGLHKRLAESQAEIQRALLKIANSQGKAGLAKSQIDLRGLARQFRGRKFGELILHHYKRLDYETTCKAVEGTTKFLPELPGEFAARWIDEFVMKGQESEFWCRQSDDVLNEIIERARGKLATAGVRPTDEDLFNMFQLIVLSFAYSFHKHESNRLFVERAIR